jgi:OOP family OmpA-OmpF porin
VAPLAWFFTAGLRFSMGGNSADGDGDGVPDRDDDCPGTPLGARVDVRGCPSDGDADGVYDGLDLCPDTPSGAMVDEHGCSIDSDGDGVPDGLDRCPGTPACVKVDEHGCPLDSDGDGVPDGLDLCPDTPAGVEVDEHGCPLDSDGDGVPDYKDQCPDTPPDTPVGPDGCTVSAREFELLDTGMLRMDSIHFASGKANITPDSYPDLREVGEILVKWPELRIEIGGHTDSQGSAEFNQKLSENRARAVFDWLMKEFPQIDPKQYVIRGYGESQSIAGNDTPEGRARNRRVEFKVLNQELLRRDLSPGSGGQR